MISNSRKTKRFVFKLIGSIFLVAFIAFSVYAFLLMENNSNSFLLTKKVHIGISLSPAETLWEAALQYFATISAEEWKKRDSNVKITILVAKNYDTQADDIRHLAQIGIDTLIIYTPLNKKSVIDTCGEVVAKEIEIFILFNRALVDAIRTNNEYVQCTFVTIDEAEYGRIAAQTIAAKLDGKGYVATFCNDNAGESTKLRVLGFKKEIAKHHDIHLLPYFNPANPGESAFNGYIGMERLLKENPIIDAVWTTDDDFLDEAITTYKAITPKRNDIKMFFGGGGKKKIVRRIMDNDDLISSDVTFPPDIVSSAINYAIMTAKNEHSKTISTRQLPNEIILRPQLITPQNAREFYIKESPY